MYDVIIVGGGPAGSTFARLLDKKYSALLIDKKQGKEDFRKPCGGLLAPRAQRALASLGDTLPKEILVDPQIFAVKTIDLKTKLVRHYPREYVNVDRHKFDLWLMLKIGENVERKIGAVTKIERMENGNYQVTFSDGENLTTAEGKYLVGADGAHSVVRNFIAPNFRVRKYMSVQQWFENENEKPFYACVFDKERTDCYSWALVKDGKFIFGGAYPEKTARSAFEKQKELLAVHGWRFGEPIKTEACFVLRPKNGKEFCFGKENAFLIGESAGFVSPSGLEGISSALISGKDLATAFNLANGNEKTIRKSYNRKAKKIKFRMLLKLFKCIPMYVPFFRKIVMKTGVTSVDVCE
ncbi:MAG: FAD-binding protein [Clostridia bacterium]|nr:FAD-binding protein [Clostridia bacterium]